MSRITLTNLGPDPEGGFDFSYSSTIDHTVHLEGAFPRVRVYRDEQQRIVVDVVTKPASNSVLMALAELHMERAVEVDAKRHKAKAISEKANPARADKKAKNDALILSAIHTYRKAHPAAKNHEIATVVARRVKRSVSAVKKRLAPKKHGFSS